MNESPNSEELSPVLNKTGKPAPTHRYGKIWFFNSLATGLAIGFFVIIGMGTSEFLQDVGGLIFLAIISATWIVPVVGIGTAIFFATKHVLTKRASNSYTSQWWLSAPALIFALAVFFYGIWKVMPQQRLARVCGGISVPAQNIKVVGYTGMQKGQWLATCEMKEADFQQLVRQQQLQPDSALNFTARLDRALNLCSHFENLSVVTNAQCYKWEYIGVDGIIHGGIYASYNSTAAHAIILSEGY